ncbi:MAG: acyl-CoA dehydrogenase family protein [Hyphomicrobiales bacterium]
MSSEVLELLREQARLLFERHCTRATIEEAEAGTWPAALWAAIEEAGLPDVLLPEDRGGSGGGLREAVAILRAQGAAAAPVPLAETMLGRWLLKRAGPGVVSLGFIGEPVAIGRSPAGDPGAGIEMAWAAAADACVLVSEATGELHIASRGAITVVRMRRSPAGEPRELIVANSSKGVGKAPPGASPLALLSLFRAAQISGALTQVLEITLRYAKERTQFGRTISNFQAIQQMLAEAAGHAAAAGVAVDIAAASASETTCASAKARAGEAAGRVAATAHQILGALGYTREYHLHTLTRRLWSWRDEAGDDVFWQARLAQHAFANGAANELWAYVTAQTDG